MGTPSIRILSILSPAAIWLTTSIPSTTLPQLVYWPFRWKESRLTMKNWLSLLIAGSPPRATPREPVANGIWLYSEGIVPPPVPLPEGSPPWMTQSSTRWKVRPSKKPLLAFLVKFWIVLETPADGSVYSWRTILPLAVSIVMKAGAAVAAGVGTVVGAAVGMAEGSNPSTRT